MRLLSTFFIGVLLLTAVGCRGAATPPATKPAEAIASPMPEKPTVDPTTTDDGPVLASDPIEYQGYTLSKQLKTVKLYGRATEFSYATLKRGGKTVAVFDGLQHPYGNATEFALLSLLGGEEKQFFIEQSIHRGSRQWVVSVEPGFEVIFDSQKFGMGRGITPIDIDHDGIFELSGLIVYYGFAHLAMSDSPQLEIVFQYDQATRRYVPANRRLVDYALRGIDEEIRSVPAPADNKYRTKILNVVLRYLFAGKEREGWDFFEAKYQLSDKPAIKAELKGKLSHEPVYQILKTT